MSLSGRGYYTEDRLLPESRRIVPRQRHDVSSAVLLLLWPFFRYCGWRDAWVLRGIGERCGPVLRLAERPTAATAAPAASRAHRSHKPWWPIRVRPRPTGLLPGSTLVVALALGGILAAGALGFAIARTSDGRQSLPALDKHVSTGGLQVSVPAGWRRRNPPPTPQLGLADVLALAPAASGGGMLVVGRAVTTDPRLLPQGLLAALPDAPRPQIVKLGKVSFYRYLNLSPRGESKSETVYAVPTTVGTILGVCLMRQASPGFTSSCERSLGALKLASGTVLPLGPAPSYASALNAVISRLNDVRRGVGSQLRAARAPRAQAKAANELAAAHAEAAAALLRLSAGPASAANAAVATALEMTGRAYGALGLAAARNDVRAYAAASASLAGATAALDSALARLTALGYRFS